MATASKARRRKGGKKSAVKSARRYERASTKARKAAQTTVVHVDAEVYARLRGDRRPEDRGMNAAVRRLIGLDRKRRVRKSGTPAAEAAEAAAVP